MRSWFPFGRADYPILVFVSISVILAVLPGLAWGAAADGSASSAGGSAPVRPGWQRRSVDWRLPGGSRVRAMHEPQEAAVPTRDQARPERPAVHESKVDASTAARPNRSAGSPQTATAAQQTISVSVVHSPPVDGFVPWVAVQATNKHMYIDDYTGYPSATVLGSFMVNGQTGYTIGILDSGAGVSVLSNAGAAQLGLLTSTWNTGGTSLIEGVTGSVPAWISNPLGLWVAGLGSIDPTTLALDTTRMVGEYNVSILMGDTPAAGAPDIATAIGSPLSVFYATAIRNDTWRSISRFQTTYDGPDVSVYDLTSAGIPSYPYRVPLELRPLGGAAVQYQPCFSILTPCPGGDGSPQVPSLIIGTGAQNLFFVGGGVDLADGIYSAINMTRFIVDTGAQVTVIGTRVAARLGLDPAAPEFAVEVQGVDGTTAVVPGFYLDTINIPALGRWLSYSHVPVIMLDVLSPEGGTLDGIVGMNLFLRYNLVLRGGGLPDTGKASLDFVALASINADLDGDGDVDMEDFGAMQACFSGPDVPQTRPECSAMRLDGDSDVDEHDLQLLIGCASGPGVPAVPECRGL